MVQSNSHVACVHRSQLITIEMSESNLERKVTKAAFVIKCIATD